MKSAIWAYRLANDDDSYIIRFETGPVDEAEAREAVRGDEQLSDDDVFDLWLVEVSSEF